MRLVTFELKFSIICVWVVQAELVSGCVSYTCIGCVGRTSNVEASVFEHMRFGCSYWTCFGLRKLDLYWVAYARPVTSKLKFSIMCVWFVQAKLV